MKFDSDKTSAVVKQVKDAVGRGEAREAMQLLRQADSNGTLRTIAGVTSALKQALGATALEELLQRFASQKCPYCTGGREVCEVCEGQGIQSDRRMCRQCAGLGKQRCPLCNGTALAGYDFVPRSLRPRVMVLRLAFVQTRLRDLAAAIPSDAPAGVGAAGVSSSLRALANHIVQLDGCRGVLANLAEQARILGKAPQGGRPLVSAADRVRVERTCRRLNAEAEAAIAEAFRKVSAHYAAKAMRPRLEAAQRALYEARAASFTKLAAPDGLQDSALSRPAALGTASH